MVNMCIFVQYMCVCVWNLAEKVTVVVDILTKQQRGSFFMGHPVVRFRSSKLRVLVQFGFGSIPISESTWTERRSLHGPRESKHSLSCFQTLVDKVYFCTVQAHYGVSTDIDNDNYYANCLEQWITRNTDNEPIIIRLRLKSGPV